MVAGAARPPATLPALSRDGVARAAHRRVDSAFLATAWASPTSRAFVVDDGYALVDTSGQPSLVLATPQQLPAGERLFLGETDGIAYFAVAASLSTAASRSGVQPLGLRDVGALLGDAEAGLLTHAVALANWHASHVRCPRCGAETSSAAGGSLRRCVADGSEHYPRVDPAVIMLVHDGGDRVVLGRAASWPGGRFSILAGFVEPGESLEHAVVREVAEEVGLAVSDIRYVGSQPWPFPSSLMLGFTARATYAELHPDPAELAEAYWFTRADIRAGTAGLPPRVSIASWLLSGWLDADVRGR
jgi:NAD+ diphosphatase